MKMIINNNITNNNNKDLTVKDRIKITILH